MTVSEKREFNENTNKYSTHDPIRSTSKSQLRAAKYCCIEFVKFKFIINIVYFFLFSEVSIIHMCNNLLVVACYILELKIKIKIGCKEKRNKIANLNSEVRIKKLFIIMKQFLLIIILMKDMLRT